MPKDNAKEGHCISSNCNPSLPQTIQMQGQRASQIPPQYHNQRHEATQLEFKEQQHQQKASEFHSWIAAGSE